MTDVEWLACEEPTPMLCALRGKASERKLHLLIVGCCRRLWPLLREDAMRNAVEVGEAHADDADFNEQAEYYDAVAKPLLKEISPEMHKGTVFVKDYGRQCLIQLVLGPLTPIGGCTLTVAGTADTLVRAVEAVGWHAAEQPPRLVARWAEVRRQEASTREQMGQCNLIRDIFGNPFRPATIDPAWVTPTALTLAQATYDVRVLPSGELDPARLAVLADALEVAGCSDANLLAHLRSPHPHVPGCWALDLILGKQ
jgi:hypothetical protein